MTVEDFKLQCMYNKSDIVVQQYLIDGTSFFFDNIIRSGEFLFKKEIANILHVHIRDIVIVGSGKLGFSIKPTEEDLGLYLFKKFDYDFTNNISKKKSDLDVAIVSSNLFDKEIENLYNYTGFHKNKWEDKNSFAKFVLKGRLAIRYLPTEFPLTKGILSVQGKYKMDFGRTVNIEIYKSWYFFETYHQENIKNIQVNLIR